MKNNEKLLTIKEVSQLFSIKESTLRFAIFKRKIPFVKIGRLIRFKIEDLNEFIKKNTKEAVM